MREDDGRGNTIGALASDSPNAAFGKSAPGNQKAPGNARI